MNTNEELIREMTALIHAVEVDDDDLADLLGRAVDALEAATTEWEYALEWNMGIALQVPSESFPTMRDAFIRHGHDPALFDAAGGNVIIGDGRYSKPPRLLRRRAAGAWEPITNEGVKP